MTLRSKGFEIEKPSTNLRYLKPKGFPDWCSGNPLPINLKNMWPEHVQRLETVLGVKNEGESPHIGTHRNRKNCLDLTTYSSDHVFIQHALRMPCLSPSAHEVQNPCRQDPPNMTAYVFIPQVLKQVQGSEKGGSRELELATRNQSLVCDS